MWLLTDRRKKGELEEAAGRGMWVFCSECDVKVRLRCPSNGTEAQRHQEAGRLAWNSVGSHFAPSLNMCSLGPTELESAHSCLDLHPQQSSNTNWSCQSFDLSVSLSADRWGEASWWGSCGFPEWLCSTGSTHSTTILALGINHLRVHF